MKKFERDGNNLYMIQTISVADIYDYKCDIKHLDGRILRITKNDSDVLHQGNGLRKNSRGRNA